MGGRWNTRGGGGRRSTASTTRRRGCAQLRAIRRSDISIESRYSGSAAAAQRLQRLLASYSYLSVRCEVGSADQRHLPRVFGVGRPSRWSVTPTRMFILKRGGFTIVSRLIVGGFWVGGASGCPGLAPARVGERRVGGGREVIGGGVWEGPESGPESGAWA